MNQTKWEIKENKQRYEIGREMGRNSSPNSQKEGRMNFRYAQSEVASGENEQHNERGGHCGYKKGCRCGRAPGKKWKKRRQRKGTILQKGDNDRKKEER
jgi:hypothetical protein